MLAGVRLVSEAADLAARRHNGMARKGRGNEPYINHLAEVANILEDYMPLGEAFAVEEALLFKDTIVVAPIRKRRFLLSTLPYSDITPALQGKSQETARV